MGVSAFCCNLKKPHYCGFSGDTVIYIPEQLRNHRFIKTNGKMPIEQQWSTVTNYFIDDPIFQQFLQQGSSYGVLCGFNNLLVIDLDNESIQKELLANYEIFNKTFTVKTAGKGLFHFYFYTDEKPDSFKCMDESYNTLIDAQGVGKQVIGAGSIGTNGKMYEVINNLPIAKVQYSVIRNIISAYDQIKNKKISIQQNGTKNKVIEQIRNKIKISKVLSDIGIDVCRNPTACPFHTSTGGRCLSFTEDLWNCFHCGKKGDIFSLVMELNHCNFPEAKQILIEKAGIKEEKKENKEDNNLKKYKELPIIKWYIYKSKEETLNKIVFNGYTITLKTDDILNPANFRKYFFNETGELLGSIGNEDWVKLVNEWIECYGELVDRTNDNTDQHIQDTIINDIKTFAIVSNPKEAISYGRMYVREESYDRFYICSRVIDLMLKKNNFKVTLSKLRFIVDDYLDGNSVVIKTGKTTTRFFRFKSDMFPEIEFNIGGKKDDNKENN